MTRVCGQNFRDWGFRDFYIQEESGNGLPGWVNLIGIESPGLTSSLAIADHVESCLGDYIGLLRHIFIIENS